MTALVWHCEISTQRYVLGQILHARHVPNNQSGRTRRSARHARDCAGCSEAIADQQRNRAACQSTLLSVCPYDPSVALVSLTYAPPMDPPSRGRSPPPTDTFLLYSGPSGITAHRLTHASLTAAPLTAATWLPPCSILLGTATGAILSVHFGDIAFLQHFRQPTVAQAMRLHQYEAPVNGLLVVGDVGGDATRCCVLIATPHVLLCFPGRGTVEAVLEQFDSASAVPIGVAIELDKGVPVLTCLLIASF